jgi:hypothetical protein
VHGKAIVRNQQLVSNKVDEMMSSHTRIAANMQKFNG